MPKEPPPEFEFIADPPSISAFDLDVVKLTAQFVARNGRQFLTQLMQKEQRNYQFDFLRPQHSLFNYFTKLVEQYTKVAWSGCRPGCWAQKACCPLTVYKDSIPLWGPWVHDNTISV